MILKKSTLLSTLIFDLLFFGHLNAQITYNSFGNTGEFTAVSRYKENGRDIDVNNPIRLGYYEYLPLSYNENNSTKYKLLIYMHGKGRAGNGVPSDQTYFRKSDNKYIPGNLDIVKGAGLPALLNKNNDSIVSNDFHLDSCIIIIPQVYKDTGNTGSFGGNTLSNIIAGLTNHYPIDTTRIYVTGFSAGANAQGEYMKAFQQGNSSEASIPAAYLMVGATAPILKPNNGSLAFFKNVGIWYISNRNDDYNSYSISRGQAITITSAGNGVFSNPNNPQNEPVEHYTFTGDTWRKRESDTITIKNGDAFYNTMVTSFKGGAHRLIYIDANGNEKNIYDNPKIYEWLFSFKRNFSIEPTLYVNAGSDIRLTYPIDSLELIGSALPSNSSAILSSCEWSQVSGNPITITSNGLCTATLGSLSVGTYTFRLSATDNEGISGFDEMTLIIEQDSVTNLPPVANAGADQNLSFPAGNIILNGSASTDDKNITTYKWKLLSDYNDEFDQKILINFTATNSIANSPWNNFLSFPSTNNTLLENLVDQNNIPTSIDIKFIEAWQGRLNKGNITGNNSGIYPDEVIKYFYFFDDKYPKERIIKLKDLSINRLYSLTFFNSANFGSPDQFTTTFTVNGETVFLDPRRNTQNTVTLNSLKPNELGELDIIVKAANGADASSISALVIQSKIDDTDNIIDINNNTQAIANVSELLPGVYNFELTVSDEEGLTDRDTTRIVVIDSMTSENLKKSKLDFNVRQIDESITLYPNPSNGNIKFQTSKEILSIQVLNNQGKILKTINKNNLLKNQINLNNFNSGVYILKFINPNGFKIAKILIE